MPEEFNDQYLESCADIFLNRFIRKYRWLSELARKYSIQSILLQGIIESLDNINHLRKEGEQVKIGLVLKSKQLKLEQPPIERRRFHISDVSKFMHFKSIVDGSSLCYIIDEKGMITIGKTPSNVTKNTSRLTLQSVSQIYQTITFYLGGFTAEIYDLGKLVRIYRRGVWMKPCIVPLTKLEAEGFPLDFLEQVLQLCIKLSEKGKGGIFVVIKNDWPKYCSPMIRDYEFRKCKVNKIRQSQILSFASLDGATILNTKCDVINIGQKLEPPPSTKYFKESGRGTKHNYAAMYSGAVDSVVFVVSEDGPISLYFDGELFARCFGDLFGTK